MLDASNGNLVVARDTDGWASVVSSTIFAHVDINDPGFEAALLTVWGEA
ncbi:hypothetical protein ACFU76_39220 [Streptomyces sp. NPDC057539]